MTKGKQLTRPVDNQATGQPSDDRRIVQQTNQTKGKAATKQQSNKAKETEASRQAGRQAGKQARRQASTHVRSHFLIPCTNPCTQPFVCSGTYPSIHSHGTCQARTPESGLQSLGLHFILLTWAQRFLREICCQRAVFGHFWPRGADLFSRFRAVWQSVRWLSTALGAMCLLVHSRHRSDFVLAGDGQAEKQQSEAGC